MHYRSRTPFPLENFRTFRISRIVVTFRFVKLDRVQGLVTMSTKNIEKVLEIDAHVNRNYDIVRRLGKGVIIFPFFYFHYSISLCLTSFETIQRSSRTCDSTSGNVLVLPIE